MYRQSYPLASSRSRQTSQTHDPLTLYGEKCNVRRKVSRRRTNSELTTTTLNLSQNVLRSTRKKATEEQNKKDNSEESVQDDEVYVESLVSRIDEMLAESTYKDNYKRDSNWISSSLNESGRASTHRPKSVGYLVASNQYSRTNHMDNDFYDIGNFSNDICISPYEGILAKLKLEQLRLEESNLIKRKTIMEKEMNRPPKSKWYESKGIDFHVESRQNSSRLSKSMDSYRTNNSTLLAYSQDFI